MVITNGLVFGEDCLFQMADVAFEGDRITQLAPVGSLPAGGSIDAGGGYVLPGFVDIHTHGAAGSDFCDADATGLENMLEYYGACGVTSVLPTTMSYGQPVLENILRTALPYFDKDGYGAVMRGVHMEGPFINAQRKGAHDPKYIAAPNGALFDALYTLAKGYIRLIGLAPELPGAHDFIRHVGRRCVVALAHTNAGYEEASAAFDAGASHVDHLFNAMPPFKHRAPGVVGAASDKASFVEVISDGAHLHASVVRAAFKWFGHKRVCLVSDSMRGAGMPDGGYDLGGQAVEVRGGRPVLAGTNVLAGSVASLAECCRRAVGFGVPIEHAVRAATLNPATAVGLQSEVGSLMPGKRADIVIWNRAMQTSDVIVGGRRLLD